MIAEAKDTTVAKEIREVLVLFQEKGLFGLDEFIKLSRVQKVFAITVMRMLQDVNLEDLETAIEPAVVNSKHKHYDMVKELVTPIARQVIAEEKQPA